MAGQDVDAKEDVGYPFYRIVHIATTVYFTSV